jgi:hypothetical protein
MLIMSRKKVYVQSKSTGIQIYRVQYRNDVLSLSCCRDVPGKERIRKVRKYLGDRGRCVRKRETKMGCVRMGEVIG